MGFLEHSPGMSVGTPPTMTVQVVSKSQLKAKLLAYLRQVEHDGKPLLITHKGTPVLEIAPYRPDPQHFFRALRRAVVSYVHPTDPIGTDRKAGDDEAV
jgi:prevent-host-death family protein